MHIEFEFFLEHFLSYLKNVFGFFLSGNLMNKHKNKRAAVLFLLPCLAESMRSNYIFQDIINVIKWTSG